MRPDPLADAPSSNPPRSLLHRWLVEYNPIYLLSATLVLAGLLLVSREFASAAAYGALAITGIAELYALALIGGCALLVRVGERRPAVMLALIAVLYQGDLTLHAETAAHLGVVGALSAIAWWALSVGKIVALSAALRLRLSRAALAVPVVGAAALVGLPQIFARVEAPARTPLVAGSVFAVGACALWNELRVECLDGFDRRGRRAVRASWALWTVLGLAHVGLWAVKFNVGLLVLAPIALLLGTRYARGPWMVCGLVVLALVFARVFVAGSFSTVAISASAVFVLHAFRSPLAPVAHPAPPALYRDPSPTPIEEPLRFGRAVRPALVPLLAGAVSAAYLAAWTYGWNGGAWPAHRWWLDATLGIVLVGLAIRGRASSPRRRDDRPPRDRGRRTRLAGRGDGVGPVVDRRRLLVARRRHPRYLAISPRRGATERRIVESTAAVASEGDTVARPILD